MNFYCDISVFKILILRRSKSYLNANFLSEQRILDRSAHRNRDRNGNPGGAAARPRRGIAVESPTAQIFGAGHAVGKSCAGLPKEFNISVNL